jgi:hypothetical protein
MTRGPDRDAPKRVERTAALLPREVLGHRHGLRLRGSVGLVDADGDEAIGVEERQRPRGDGGDGAGDGRVAPMPTRERERRDGGEARRAAEHPPPVPRIVAQVLEPGEAARVAAAIGQRGGVAELAPGRAPRGVARQPFRFLLRASCSR